jgi:hypothetical protein
LRTAQCIARYFLVAAFFGTAVAVAQISATVNQPAKGVDRGGFRSGPPDGDSALSLAFWAPHIDTGAQSLNI